MTVVYVISAPSGSGKSTLVSRLLESDPRLLFSISYTTRKPRGNEKPGQNYHYISREEFEGRIQNSEFLEWAQVFENYYGTHQGYLDRARAEDRDLVLDIDVQGARQLKEKIPDAVSIFILPPSRQILEQRLRARSEDSSAVIERRLREAAEEIRHWGQYDYVLVNQEVETAAGRLQSIFEAERLRRSRVEGSIQPILESFSSIGEPPRKRE